MKKSEKARLQEIYDQIEGFKSELEDLVDSFDDDDEEEAIQAAIDSLEDTVDALDDLVDTESVRITVTGDNAAELLTKLQTLLTDEGE